MDRLRLMGLIQKLKSSSPFKKVTRIINASPIQILFMVSRIPAPPGPQVIIPLPNIPFHSFIKPRGEITFDPSMLFQGPDGPSHVYVMSSNQIPNLVPQFVHLDNRLVKNSAEIIFDVRIGEIEHQFEVKYRNGTRLKRSKALVKTGIALRGMKKILSGSRGVVQVEGNPLPLPPPPPSPPESSEASTDELHEIAEVI